MKSKNSVYCFLVLVLLLGMATVTDLLVYTTYGPEFFMTALFVLVTLLVLSIFLFSSTLGSLFSVGVFSITILTGLFSFQRLFPEQLWLLALLLVVGIFGFIGTLLACTSSSACKKEKCSSGTCGEMKTAPVAPAMQFPFKPLKKQKGVDVSTYDVETPEMQSLALMESLEAMKNAEKETLGDDEFVELDDIEKMMTTKRAPAKKLNGKKKSKK
ncbi:hypothetical protein HZC31_06495 [Candidatus Woesearchaeota archaeon]|nr:hypothetical protein [Candidatus Woesearchaeota archaeon]